MIKIMIKNPRTGTTEEQEIDENMIHDMYHSKVWKGTKIEMRTGSTILSSNTPQQIRELIKLQK